MEPNPKMDALLSRYSRRRRVEAQPDLEMTDQVRSQLHAEMFRTYRSPHGANPTLGTWLQTLWPKLAWGGAVAACLCLGCVWLFHSARHQASNSTDQKLAVFADHSKEQDRIDSGPGTMLNERLSQFEIGAKPMAPTELREAPAQAAARVPAQTEPLASGPATEPGKVRDRVEVALAEPVGQPERDLGWASNVARMQYRLPEASGSGPLVPPENGAGALGVAESPAANADTAAPGPTLASRAVVSPTLQEAQTELSANARPLTEAGTRAPQAPVVDNSVSRESEVAKLPTGAPLVASAPPGVPMPSPVRAKAAVASGQPQLAASSVSPPRIAQRTARFQQIDPQNRYRRNLNSPPSPKVLTEFEVQRDGDNLQIVDADGSVYRGQVQVAQARAQKRGATEAAAPEAYLFQVAGTNQVLNQPVVFTGEFEPMPTQAQTSSMKASGTSAARSSPAPTASQAQSTGRITGKVSLGGKDELKIEAQQVAP